MPLIDPPQTSVDLSKTVPGGWTLVGFSEPRSDGVNPFRVPQAVTEIRFSTPGPRYVQFDYQLFSPGADVQARVTLDGQPLGRFTFPAGTFVTVNPAGFVKTGSHVLRFEQECMKYCPVSQYYAKVHLVGAQQAQKDIALGAKRWYLDAPASKIKTYGLSGPLFDGANFYRILDDQRVVSFALPVGSPKNIFRYQTISDTGAYRLSWQAPGHRNISIQTDQAKFNSGISASGYTLGALPKGQFVDQSLQILNAPNLRRLQLKVKCKDGVKCFPLKLYHVELTSLNAPPGFLKLTTGEQLGGASGFLGALLLFALVLRPARARR